MSIPGARHCFNPFTCIFSRFSQCPYEVKVVTPHASDLGNHTYWNQKRVRGSQTYMQKGCFAEFCVVPASSMEDPFRHLREDPFSNNPLNTRAFSRPYSFQQPGPSYSLRGPVKNQNVELLCEKIMENSKISRQKSIKPRVACFRAGGPVWLPRSHIHEVCPANSFFPGRFPLS